MLKGYRRLVFAGVIFVLSYLALWWGKLGSDELVELWKWLAIGYLGSDGVEKVGDALKKRGGGDVGQEDNE